MLLVLSLSGVVAAATVFTAATGPAPAAEPLPTVDTTASFEDIDGNGIDDDCQAVRAVAADQTVIDAEVATVDVNADGVISTTEAAHSARIGGKNCNHGGYVSWIAHQSDTCTVAPTDPTVQPVVATLVTADETAETDETETPDATQPEADACDVTADSSVITASTKDKVAAAAARAASKAERKLAHEAAKAERTAARTAAKAERNAARDAKKAAQKAAHAAKAKHHSH
jgi:hypothetical protein